jgi:hypothetical protein
MAEDFTNLKFIDKLFLLTDENEEILAPVVTLQNEPFNIYGLLEQRFIIPEGLPPPDQFFRAARSLTDPPLETWRPRVNGVQLKVLQGARLPRHDYEWAALGRALVASSQQFRPGVFSDALLLEIKQFTAGVELWWNDRKRNSNEPNSGAGSNKRSLPQLGGSPTKQQQQQMNILPQQPQVGLATLTTTTGALHSYPLPEQRPQQRQQQQHHPQETQTNTNTVAPDQCITLNVGGDQFITTSKTLASVENSFFYKVTRQQPLPSDVFIDRNGRLFGYCLDYLRCRRFGETYVDLPKNDKHALNLLLREAQFYNLKGLVDIVNILLASK